MKMWTTLATAAAVALATGCAAYTEGPPAAGSGAPASERLRVAAASYPFQFVAERVGGDQVTVSSLTPPGAEPHDLELTPQQVAALADDDLLVYQSGFQPAVDAALSQARPRRTIDTSTFLVMLAADGHAEGESDDHEHGALDPHTWLDPMNLADVGARVRDALSEARPEAAAEFAANTEALVTDLDALHADLTADLTGCRVRAFVTSHAAFGYLAKRYDLEQVPIAGIEPDVEPSAARIAEVQRLAREYGVTTIFFETLASPAVARSIAGDLGLRTAVLDPIEGLTDESAGADYLTVMRANGAALKEANQCS